MVHSPKNNQSPIEGIKISFSQVTKKNQNLTVRGHVTPHANMKYADHASQEYPLCDLLSYFLTKVLL